MEESIIKAIGQLSVEVVAIIALAGALYFQAKASSDQAKEMKNLTAAISEHVKNGVEHNLKMAEAVAQIKNTTEHNVELIKTHHLWVKKATQSLEKTT